MHELILSLGSLYLTYLHSLFELQVTVDDDEAALLIETGAQSGDAYSPSAATLPLPSPTHSSNYVASSTYRSHTHATAQPSLSSPRSQGSSRAGLFRSRSVQSPSNTLGGTQSPSPSSPAPGLTHSVSETYESLRMQSPGGSSANRVPRYMMHSKSFSSKVKSKAGKTTKDAE
ncbi:hypothetical protein EON64_18295 [archaeon]|nr:MAG: hypothetical protein EON64_18295 [archaeon]